MQSFHKFLSSLRALFGKRKLDAEIDEEMRSHIELRTRANIEAGMEPSEARYAALREFGWKESIKEECREQRGVSWIENLFQDLRYGARQLLKNPGFTTVAVLTLAFGIGANTAIFSVINAVLLRPLPYLDSDRLVAVCESNPRQGWDHYVTSIAAYSDWARENSSFQQLAAATVLGPTTAIDGKQAELVHFAAVSANFFSMLGIRPILGREFVSEEQTPDRGDVVLLSESLWRERFGGDLGILNRSVQLGDRSFTVVGVMPRSIRLFDPAGVQGWDNGFSKSDIWRPLPVDSGLRKQRSYRAFLVLGRLKPSVSLAQAQTEMANIAREQEKNYPDSNTGWGVSVEPWQQAVVRNARKPLALLFASAGIVLLIATANLGNLCLTRGLQRQKEFAIRRALGARLFRIGRQFLAESLLLSLLGGATGLIPATVPRADEINLDGRVLGFTFVTLLIVSLLVGLVPLLAFWKSDVNHSLKLEARGSTGSLSGRYARATLVAAQIALVMVLLTGAGLLTRSILRLNEINPGFQPNHLVAMDISLGGRAYTNEFQRIQFVDQLLAHLTIRPEIESAAAVDGLPLDGERSSMDIALTSVEGVLPSGPEGKRVAGLRLASPGYFQTMGVSLAQGRFFTERDNIKGPPAVIINEALAKKYFSDRDPIGKRIVSPDFGSQPCEIVGVVKDIRQSSLETNPKPEVFRPLLQKCFDDITLVVRSRAASTEAFAVIRQEATSAGWSLPTYNSRTLDQLVTASLAPRRFALCLMGAFAGLALILALVGVYGVLSCAVIDQTREIGVRLALGAPRRNVLYTVLVRGMRSVAIGGVIGLAGACALMRYLGSLLYEVSPMDPMTLLAVTLLIAAMALIACWLPAHRATKIDPMEALKCE